MFVARKGPKLETKPRCKSSFQPHGTTARHSCSTTQSSHSITASYHHLVRIQSNHPQKYIQLTSPRSLTSHLRAHRPSAPPSSRSPARLLSDLKNLHPLPRRKASTPEATWVGLSDSSQTHSAALALSPLTASAEAVLRVR